MKNLKSFTLIELLVVIVIIGILSGLVVVATTSFVNSTSNAKLVAELSTLAKTLETQASYPVGSFCLEDTTKSQDLLNALGMTKPPKHPSYSAGDTNNCFLYFSDGNHYSIRVNSLGNKGILVQESRHMKTAGIKDKCEEGWIPIGNRCVMKYEAKAMTSSGTIVADGCYSGACLSNTAVSVPEGKPWVKISQKQAKVKCEEIGAHLITNAEWMAIARDIETVDSNKTSGVLSRGRSSSGSSAPATSEEGSGATKRNFTLSNGEVIWDIAGNVWEWVDFVIPTQAGIEGTNASYTEIRTGINWATSTNPYISYDEVGPLGALTSSEGAGRMWKDNTITSAGAFVRGGRWDDGADAGVFALALASAPSHSTHTHLGFRCARY
ncbi:MAG: SUMF1/EgtB/PvdO family nonheme iron enzyme [Candidatus Paceibacterota bacterium]